VTRRLPATLAIAVLYACTPRGAAPPPVHAAAHVDRVPAKRAPVVSASHDAKSGAPPRDGSGDAMLAWLRDKLPPGGTAKRDEHGAVVVTHHGAAKETIFSVAKAYVGLTTVYMAEDLARRIAKANAISIFAPSVANKTVTIPDIVQEPWKSPDEERMPWPADRKLRAIYLGGRDALGTWESTLDHLRARDMNAVILDGKAYMGEITYPSKVDVAVKDGAANDAPIVDLSRTIRFAHKRGVRVIMRISCFHDPYSAKKAPELSVKGYWGGPYPIGWLDPGDAKAQKYIFDLVNEEIALGADEINLDYVRYPVQRGLGNAEFHLKDTGRTRVGVVTDFIAKVHAITQAHHIPLSLDIFGVTATGTQLDVDNLGQDIGKLSPNAEVLMPMVYPSHYGTGFYGWAVPGNHPEIVAIGTKAAVQKAATGKAIIRPWLQAFMWRSPDYGPHYLAQEILEGEKGGGVGYAMWNPGGHYGDAWQAVKPLQN
jgi:hypothetical protein